MTRVLVTGGTGLLGRAVTSRLLDKGYTVRVMSRSPRRGTSNVEWAQAQMLTGEGVAEAMKDVDVVVHAATDTRLGKTDVKMTRHVVEAAKAARVGYLVYISIIGVDKTSFSYHKIKVACETMVQESGIPYASIRFSQFFEFIDLILHTLTKLPIGFVPMAWKSQPMDSGEAADQVVKAVDERPIGLLPDVGGPQVLTFKEMLHEWQQARGSQKPVLPLPAPGELPSAFRNGLLVAPNQKIGKMTWAQWCGVRYGQARQTGEKVGPVYSFK